MNKPKILLVEDDPGLGFVLQDNLTMRGFDVRLCHDGEAGGVIFREGQFDICLLDVMLPKLDGFSLGKYIRQMNQDIPILYLTARSMTEDKLDGFRSGGDDYITKPFNIDELVMRIHVFLRRPINSEANNRKVFSMGDYLFNHSNLELTHKTGNKKILTVKESEVLKLLFVNRDRVMKREEILTRVWGNDDYFMGRSMDVFISKLRKYLSLDSRIEIVNYHGVGFKFKIKDS